MGQDRQAAIAKDLGRARARLEKAVRREAKLRTEWLDAVDEESPGRDIAEAAYPHVVRERDDARAAVERLEEALDAEPPPTENAMLDAYSALRDALRGGGDIGELNERLRAKFQEFRLDRVDDVVVGVVRPSGRTRRRGRLPRVEGRRGARARADARGGGRVLPPRSPDGPDLGALATAAEGPVRVYG